VYHVYSTEVVVVVVVAAVMVVVVFHLFVEPDDPSVLISFLPCVPHFF
jgi:hypothetical protein